MPKIDLQINIPLSGSVRYVDFYPSREWQGKQMSAQVRLKGTFGGSEGEIYLPAVLLPQLQKDGMVMEAGTKEHNGTMIPQYRWTHPGLVTVFKAQEGRTTRTTVTSGTNGGSPSPNPQAIVAPRASQAHPVRAALDAALQAPGFQRALPGQDGVILQPPKVNGLDPWSQLARDYAKAKQIAQTVWGEQGLGDEAIASAVAAVFIESQKRGLRTEPTATEAQAVAHPAETFEEMPESLEAEDDLPFSVGRSA